jgi:hypothetical protein
LPPWVDRRTSPPEESYPFRGGRMSNGATCRIGLIPCKLDNTAKNFFRCCFLRAQDRSVGILDR